ncbi:hypothetical protein TRFO_24091 [Tritrichomonas foetus]|uniref:DBF4-type domain-containing protein n=1 Tax=Tritrichomonas foetus TaxID=1144522 RepID=A0A1J4K9U1_9EUKA|nr:hypothetical protein TRFO_24091 [Tritrichomonas foetus]|eukprot:OHT07672.1 hypothetical protein TRFO_24091 [Tritrichomonas foetus]
MLETESKYHRKNIIVSLAPKHGCELSEIRTPTSPKPSSLCNSTKSNSKIMPIHPFFFKDLNVKVFVQNNVAGALISKNLQILGAKIISSPSQIPDVIIVDQCPEVLKGNDYEKKTARYGYSRMTKIPKIISCSQIPWIFGNTVQTFNEFGNIINFHQIQPKVAPKNSVSDSNNIIISDAHHKFRPIQGHFRVSNLDLKAVPKHYLFSPYTPVPENPQEFIELTEKHRKMAQRRPFDDPNPWAPGYCEICNKNFTDAGEHRRSQMHREKVQQPDLFVALDAMIKEINFL